MGWVMFAFGLATLAGPIGFFGLLATILWVLVAGIWMVRQGPPVPEHVTPLAGHHGYGLTQAGAGVVRFHGHSARSPRSTAYMHTCC